METVKEYKYYSTQRPVSIGTFPKHTDNPPIRFENYNGRTWVECNTRPRIRICTTMSSSPPATTAMCGNGWKPRPRWLGNGKIGNTSLIPNG